MSKLHVWVVLMAGVLLVAAGLLRAEIAGTAHDLSATQGGGNACRFCHTPHGAIAGTPLWNHSLSDAVYKIYESSSLEAQVGQPTGASKLCLSCHDGTVALGDTLRGGQGGTYIAPGGELGTDLSDDHPISFVYSSGLAAQDTQLRFPAGLPAELALGDAGELECTTCHDPHDDSFGDFLVMSNANSAMCQACHEMDGWGASVHRAATANLAGTSDLYLADKGYATVAEAACQACHQPHSAGGHERLLHWAKMEDNCLSCHDGSVAQTDMRGVLNQVSGHDVRRYDGEHDQEENPLSFTRHVECVDCHQPHGMQAGVAPGQAPAIMAEMQGSSGVTITGVAAEEAGFEYEVCFKCHGDRSEPVNPPITRQVTQFNTRLEFDPANPSYHPVAAPGANPRVPSLINGLTEASQIYCGDCHASDATSAVAGPHGSRYAPLLAYRYETADETIESTFAYELCYQCHSRNILLGDESFPHSEHLADRIPCSACHDPHGISASQGTAEQNSHLINFDVNIVSANPQTGELGFRDLGTHRGSCSLSCHGELHDSRDY